MSPIASRFSLPYFAAIWGEGSPEDGLKIRCLDWLPDAIFKILMRKETSFLLRGGVVPLLGDAPLCIERLGDKKYRLELL